MQTPLPDASLLLDGTPFGLCGACPGVDFVTTTASGGRVPCTVSAAVLHHYYGAAHDVPSSWLSAFLRHRQHIDEQIIAALGGRENVDRVFFNHAAGASRIFMRRGAVWLPCLPDRFILALDAGEGDSRRQIAGRESSPPPRGTARTDTTQVKKQARSAKRRHGPTNGQKT